MTMTDPISDMLTRIRNGQKARKVSVSMPASNAKEAVARVLKDEGYITGYSVEGEGATKELNVELKYFEGSRASSAPAVPDCAFTAVRKICPRSWAASA
jgi:small subunit ribosomal protein S8